MKTFPHFYEDGYVITDLLTTGWKQIYYGGLYRNTHGMPYQWNKFFKRHKPIALFMQSEWRCSKTEDGKKCWYGCNLTYKYSAN